MVDWKSTSLNGKSYWVFDDFTGERLKSSYKQFMGCQEEFTVTDKYMTKKTLFNFGPAIYLFNDYDYHQLRNHLDWNWCRDNCVIINVQNKLY